MIIRKAKLSDIKYIYKLILHFSKKGDVVPRPLAELYEQVREFFVCEDRDLIVGACSLHVLWEDLAEVKSLVVSEEYHRQGIGSKLIEACLKEAKELGIPKVFVLTTSSDFFKRFGFKEVNKQELPQKVWADCIKCSKFPECDEVPMVLELR